MVLSRQPKPDVLINEISLMKSCQHPAIVQFHDSFLVTDTLWVVMELVDGEDLTQVEREERGGRRAKGMRVVVKKTSNLLFFFFHSGFDMQ